MFLERQALILVRMYSRTCTETCAVTDLHSGMCWSDFEIEATVCLGSPHNGPQEVEEYDAALKQPLGPCDFFLFFGRVLCKGNTRNRSRPPAFGVCQAVRVSQKPRGDPRNARPKGLLGRMVTIA